jgi:aminoglycoside phosphotransferase (APT) family kinase protein
MRGLLDAAPDETHALVERPDRASYRVRVGEQWFAVKIDDDRTLVAREVAGNRRAAAAGVPVPTLVDVADDAFVTAWVDGVPLVAHATDAAWAAAGAQLRTAHDVGGTAPFGAGFGGFDSTHGSWRDFFEAFAAEQLLVCERELDFPARAADRVRAALRAAHLDSPHLGWCHGDCQPDHVLVDPVTDEVVAIIDWADHGSADVTWDVGVLTLDNATHLGAFLDGYRARDELRAAFAELLPLYQVVRLVGEACWLAAHGYPYADSFRRAVQWQP